MALIRGVVCRWWVVLGPHDPRPAMRDELHHLVDIVTSKPNGVRTLSILIDQARPKAQERDRRSRRILRDSVLWRQSL